MGIAPTAVLPLNVHYQGLEACWACALGHMARRIGATVLPEELAVGAYRHLFEVDTTLATYTEWAASAGWNSGEQGFVVGQQKVRRGTLAIDYQVSVWEWLSCMINSFTLQVTPASVSLTVDLLSHSLSRASVVNTTATMTKLLPPYVPRARPDQAVCRIAPFSASTPLGNSDVLQLSTWTLRVDNHLVAGFGPRLGTAPEEYERSRDPTITLTFVDPRHVTDVWQTRWGANTVLMADCKLIGPLIGATGQHYQLNQYLPSVQVTNAQLNTSGAGLPPDVVQCVAVVPSAAAAGLPSFNTNTPLAIEVVSALATHPLV
jgi:hypothetical protein